MILEGIVTTLNPDGEMHVAPMGPIVDVSMSTLQLRPFQSSSTFQNLVRTEFGVFHVVDDVLLLARAAIGPIEPAPAAFGAERIEGFVLSDACRWYEFEIVEIDDHDDRAEMSAKVVHSGRLRDLFGFNRAKHAVLEAAILATRVHLLPQDEILHQFELLKVPVHKTAGPRETEAFDLLEAFVLAAYDRRGDGYTEDVERLRTRDDHQ
jgi:hypothetical protein